MNKEFYDLMEQFERDYHHLRMDREKDKTLWKTGNVYECGETNKTFLIYCMGYSYGKTIIREKPLDESQQRMGK